MAKPPCLCTRPTHIGCVHGHRAMACVCRASADCVRELARPKAHRRPDPRRPPRLSCNPPPPCTHTRRPPVHLPTRARTHPPNRILIPCSSVSTVLEAVGRLRGAATPRHAAPSRSELFCFALLCLHSLQAARCGCTHMASRIRDLTRTPRRASALVCAAHVGYPREPSLMLRRDALPRMGMRRCSGLCKRRAVIDSERWSSSLAEWIVTKVHIAASTIGCTLQIRSRFNPVVAYHLWCVFTARHQC